MEHTPTRQDIIEAAFQGYVDCALWSSSIEEDFAHAWNAKTGEDVASGVSFQSFGFEPADLSSDALNAMRADLADFIAGCGVDVDAYLEHASAEAFGHDFWLTRNRHGAGFWDRGLGALGDRLTSMAHPYGESHLYATADETIHVA
jgi:hypothetical protein